MEPTCALYILDPALPVWRLHCNSMQQRLTVSERIPTDSSVEYFFPETAVLWADLFFQSHQGTMTSFAAACSAIDSFPQEIVCFFYHCCRITSYGKLFATFSAGHPISTLQSGLMLRRCRRPLHSHSSYSPLFLSAKGPDGLDLCFLMQSFSFGTDSQWDENPWPGMPPANRCKQCPLLFANDEYSQARSCAHLKFFLCITCSRRCNFFVVPQWARSRFKTSQGTTPPQGGRGVWVWAVGGFCKLHFFLIVHNFF